MTFYSFVDTQMCCKEFERRRKNLIQTGNASFPGPYFKMKSRFTGSLIVITTYLQLLFASIKPRKLEFRKLHTLKLKLLRKMQ